MMLSRSAIRSDLSDMGYDNELTSRSVHSFCFVCIPWFDFHLAGYSQWITYLLRTTKSTKDPSINQKLRRVPLVVFPYLTEETRARIIERINPPIRGARLQIMVCKQTRNADRALTSDW